MSARGLMGRWSAQDIRRVAKIAWPTILENIMVIMVSFVDTAMVGQLGEDATAAVAVNASPSWLLNGACAAIQVGATVLVAQAIGSRDREGANKVARQAMTLGLCMGAFLMVLMMAISGWLPAALRAEARIVPVAAQYIPHFTGLVISGILRGTGDTKTPMKVNLAANVVNIIGNFFLIYESRTVSIFGLSIPVWGAGLGVVGAAIPSAFSMAMVGVVLFIRVVRGAGDIRFERHQSYRPRWNVVRNMLRIGMPAAMERVCVNAGHMIFQTMVAGLGTASLAAHHLATTAESLSYMPAYGFGVSATTLVGQAVGAGDTEGAALRLADYTHRIYRHDMHGIGANAVPGGTAGHVHQRAGRYRTWRTGAARRGAGTAVLRAVDSCVGRAQRRGRYAHSDDNRPCVHVGRAPVCGGAVHLRFWHGTYRRVGRHGDRPYRARHTDLCTLPFAQVGEDRGSKCERIKTQFRRGG